jgi:DNA polymerase-3 subunit delta'
MAYTVDEALERLAHAQVNQRLAHAYLLIGPAATVYDQLVIPWLTGLLGRNAATHPDVHHVRPLGKRREIPVALIRELISNLSRTSLLGGAKAGVIHEADRLNPNSANAFLKTLEEPTPRTLLILITERPGALLPTLLSRCLKIRLRGFKAPEPDPELQPLLARLQAIEPGQIAEVLAWSGQFQTYLRNLRASVLADLADDASDIRAEEEDEKEADARLETEYRARRADSLRFIIEVLQPKAPKAVQVVDSVEHAFQRNLPEPLGIEHMLLQLLGRPVATPSTGSGSNNQL